MADRGKVRDALEHLGSDKRLARDYARHFTKRRHEAFDKEISYLQVI